MDPKLTYKTPDSLWITNPIRVESVAANSIAALSETTVLDLTKVAVCKLGKLVTVTSLPGPLPPSIWLIPIGVRVSPQLRIYIYILVLSSKTYFI